MGKNSKYEFKNSFRDYLGITLGTLIMAFAFNSFSVPNKIAPGGFSGLATVLYHVTGLPVGVITWVLTVPVFFVGVKVLGGRFGIKTLYATTLFSVGVDAIMRTPAVTHDIFLASVFGGVVLGLGVGTVLKFGATTGGTDLLAAILHRGFRGLSVGMWLMIVDTVVIIIAGIAFQNFEITLYSSLTLFLSMKMIDLIQEGFSYAKAFYIISDKGEELGRIIVEEMGRGVTLLSAKGAYTGADRQVIMCVVHRSQIFKLKDVVRTVDPRAFVILSDVYEVLGEGFKKIEE
ncbi:MAG TPA: hypothetical protein DHN33_04025 [Eubacteriaceae bacterium]|nr:hypothetical protein [Eubacteriaceae bacterium]